MKKTYLCGLQVNYSKVKKTGVNLFQEMLHDTNFIY